MNPSFDDITYFIEVAQTGNISRAAERLGLTQPSLSSAIRRLEDSLGTTLFLRGRTGVELTKGGKELLANGRQLLLHWQQLKANILKREETASGRYVIGCHPTVALYSLPHFLPGLLQKYPDLEVQLVHDISRKITEGVVSFEIDFGIVVNPVRHPDLVIRELCTDEMGFWTAKVASATQNLDSEGGVLICESNLLQVRELLGKLNKRAFKRTVHSSSLELVAGLTASGAGVGIIPKRAIPAALLPALKPMSGMPVFKDKICLVYRADAQRTLGSKILIQAITAGIR